uniref:Putative GTPase n=1 Tax=Streptomyces sp. L-49973 TaxID=762837 RepID=E0WFN5_9ACTN|nr:putative GTPase [Streptomyces sp. L-49973]
MSRARAWCRRALRRFPQVFIEHHRAALARLRSRRKRRHSGFPQGRSRPGMRALTSAHASTSSTASLRSDGTSMCHSMPEVLGRGTLRTPARILEKGDTLFSQGIVQGSGNEELLHDLHLLTTKPFLYVFNVDEEELTDDDFKAAQSALVAPAEAIFLNAKLESDLAELDDEEALELLQSVGQEEPGLATLAHVGFRTLGLQTYLTAGPKESRAWTIKKGATAPEAAGVIHTDFQKGFIKAEVISFADLVETGSVAEARAKGKARMEGKEYVMQDGDVVEFRFNV